jgi:peptidylprolyl isomerase
MRSAVLGVAGGSVALVVLSACSGARDEPTITVPSTPVVATAPAPTPGAGKDVIAGSVSRSLRSAPRVLLPHTAAPHRLLTKDIVTGTGQVSGPESTVTVRYIGLNYATGQVFHSTWTTAGTESFSLVGYVVGFAEGVAGMRAGGRREIIVPPSLAYGSESYGAVGPNETLVFVVDLIKVS